MRLIENAVQSAYRNFALIRNDGGTYCFAHRADEPNMTTALSRFEETRRLQTALHFGTGEV
jgi:hypothetical protein